MTILAVVVMVAISFNEQRRIKTETVNQIHEVVDRGYLVLPDQVTVSGNLISAWARDLKSGQRVNLLYYARNEAAANYFKDRCQVSEWRVTGKVQPIEPATNFNQFDAQKYFWQFHTYNQVKCQEVRVQRIPQSPNLVARCHELRARMYQSFDRFPHPLAGYCQQLILGMQNKENAELMQNVKRLGLIHLFCLSGMYVVLIVNLLRRLLVYCHVNREDIEWLLLLALPFYLIIGGGSISLLRATIMAEMGLIQRRTKMSSLDGWSISLLGGLLTDPWLLMTLGGQLSYLLSFALQVIPERVSGYQRSFLLSLLGVPSLLAFVYEVHVLTFICSFIVIPFFASFIFPAVIISALSYPLLPVIGLLVNHLLRIFELVLAFLSHCPGMITFGKPVNPFIWLMLVLTLILIDRFNWRWLIMIGTLYGGAFLLIHVPLTGEVTFVDIGQGDCALIRYPLSNRVEMVDTGGKLSFGKASQNNQKQNNYATRTSINYLKSQGISRIDTVYLSHHDVDHIGYLPTVLQAFRVQQLVVPSGMEDQAALAKLIPTDARQRPRIIPATADQHFRGSKLMAIHPFSRGQANNEDSLVLTGNFGGRRFLFMGDLDRNGEKRVISRYPNLRTDVLKLGHHGSRTASDPLFLSQVRPAIGIISAGRQNRYGHPNQETMENVHRVGIKTVSTQKYGMIRYKYNFLGSQWQTKLRGDEYQWMSPR